tara:strand:- start:1638 stop:2846 length:1209 start_codon:yes stop_codon:yes gene_type:complete
MARFSQTFLQGLLQPTYQQGLFEAARNVGQTPGMMAMQERRETTQAQVQQLLQTNANNPTELARLEQQYRLQGKTDIADMFAKASVTAKSTLKQEGMNSISAIQQQLMQETDPAKMQLLEDAIVDVARRTGQSDPSSFVGSANKVLDARTRRENELFTQQEQAIAKAYYAVSDEDKDQFIKNAENGGFGKIITQLEVERLRHENYVEDSNRRKTDARSPLNIPAMEKRIKDLPKNQQAQFEERLDEIRKLEPNFDNGETWGTGERERAWRQLDSLDRALFNANATIISTANSRIKTLDTRLNTINKELEKPASNQEAKLYVTQAVSEISEERGSVENFLRTDVPSSDDRVKQRAIELATAKKNEALTQEKANIEAELVELQKTFEPVTEEEETKSEDPLGIR